MKVAFWAEVRRLHEIEHRSNRAIARQLRCCTKQVAKALAMDQPPNEKPQSRGSILDPFRPKIDALVAKNPDLTAVRVRQEIAKGPNGYTGSVDVVRDYLRQSRPAQGRVYQEVVYEPGEAMQVDWGTCGRVLIGRTWRCVSVFVAVLCYSRMLYLEFCLSQRKVDFYRGLVNAVNFFGGSPLKLIVDNLKAAVLNGSGRHACFHPEFLALCGYFCMQPIACARRDPESKGIVEASVKYIKRNALAGRAEELQTFEDYQRFAPAWRDGVANVRDHATTHQQPVERLENEHARLRPLPPVPFDTDEILSATASSHARVRYDANRYSVPPEVVGKIVVVRAGVGDVRIEYQGREVARHARSYEKGTLVEHPDHRLAALQTRKRRRASERDEEFDALGPVAREFHLKLLESPVKTGVHLQRLLKLARIYGRQEILAAIREALARQTCDAAYVEAILLQDRRRRELPSPTPLAPKRRELIEDIHLEEPDPGWYDRFCGPSPDDEEPKP